MDEVTIKGKKFTVAEVRDYGKKAIAKTKKILTIIGISLIACCAIVVLMTLSGKSVNAETGETTYSLIPPAIIGYGIPGIILLIIAFLKTKKDPYAAGITYLNNHFPYPVGNDGNITSSLQGDKTLKLSSRLSIIISSREQKFQIVQGNKYSKIFTGKDILEYEIKVDNEVVITSKTKNKKGIGKAIVGGALLGGFGLIAGAIAGNSKSATKQQQKEIHHYILSLKINDILHPSYVVDLPSLQSAEEVAATFAVLCQNNYIEENDTATVETKYDKFEEIKKYKDLLDSGIITQEEFDAKKKHIMGL